MALLVVICFLSSVPSMVLASPTVTTTYSKNWSGYIGNNPHPFNSISASWTVPAVATPSHPSYSSVWIGIGGAYQNSNKLVQAGTEQDVNSDGSTTYYAWYEIYPKLPVNLGPVAPGDSISTSIYRTPGSPPTWHITMIDTTADRTLIDTDIKLKTNFASQASAEFIVERPLIRVGNQLTPLADFNSVTFTNCETDQGSLSALGDVTKVIMTDDGTSSGTHLATPGSLSGDDFSVTRS